MSESQKACSLWLPLKEAQVLTALHKSCQEISSHQLSKEAVVPQLNNPPPHNKMLSINPEETFSLVTDLKCPRRWRKHFFLFNLSSWIPSTSKTVTCKIHGILIFFFFCGVRSPKCTLGPEQAGMPWDGMCGWHLGAWSWESSLSCLTVLLGVTASKHHKNDEESGYGAEKWGGKRELEKYWWGCCRVSVSVSGLSLKPWGVLGLQWECREQMWHWGAELKTQTVWARLLILKPKRKQQKCVKPQKSYLILL